MDFFYHFINMKTAQREWKSEVSIIDTAIFICGALLAGEYFGGEIKEKAETLYERINWNWYTDKSVNQFYMGYSKEKRFLGTLGYVCRTIDVICFRSSFANICNR